MVADNGNPAKIDYDDQLQLGFEDLTADTLKSERSISPIMRNTTTSHGISDAHFSLAEHDDDRIAFRQLPRRRNRFGK